MVKMVNLNRISPKIENRARKFVSGLGKGDLLLPIILLETAVTGGRTYHAYKRGGAVEARERFSEESVTAVFWLGGVSAFNKIGDAIGKKLLGFKDVNFEVGKDLMRNPMKNYIGKMGKCSEKSLAAFKFTKIISSILLTNAVIGIIIPKYNQAITKKYQKFFEKFDKKEETKENKLKTNASTKSPSFKGSGVQTLLALTDCFENDSRYKLIAGDAGMTTGRAVSARNKYESREVIFRDVASVYFYMFCRSHLNSVLNLIENGRSTRLDPVIANKLDSHLRTRLKGKNSYTAQEFEKLVLGQRNAEIPKEVQSKINNGIINLTEFKKIVGVDSEIAKRAERMSRIQPKLEGISILSTEQIKDVYSSGLIDEPRFLNKIYRIYTDKKSTNPMKFVPEKDLRNLKKEMTNYVEDILKKAKSSGENITLDTLKKANKANFIKNALNLGAGFALSAYFLSTAIPKIQYWLTKKQTGDDKFPGIQTYDK